MNKSRMSDTYLISALYKSLPDSSKVADLAVLSAKNVFFLQKQGTFSLRIPIFREMDGKVEFKREGSTWRKSS